MKDTVLLVVDVQTALVQDHPYQEESLISNIKRLISFCRKQALEVIYVRHDGGVGDELEYNSDGWQIYKEISPQSDEKIFEKHYNSAFKLTGLKEYLEQQGIQTIILVGMQTEYCIDTTCKAAFEYGYNLIIPEGAVTTFDNGEFTGKALNEFYYYNIWKNRFAKVESIDELEKDLSK
jgi:nicotinamidase-related amidase